MTSFHCDTSDCTKTYRHYGSQSVVSYAESNDVAGNKEEGLQGVSQIACKVDGGLLRCPVADLRSPQDYTLPSDGAGKFKYLPPQGNGVPVRNSKNPTPPVVESRASIPKLKGRVIGREVVVITESPAGVRGFVKPRSEQGRHVEVVIEDSSSCSKRKRDGRELLPVSKKPKEKTEKKVTQLAKKNAKRLKNEIEKNIPKSLARPWSSADQLQHIKKYIFNVINENLENPLHKLNSISAVSSLEVIEESIQCLTKFCEDNFSEKSLVLNENDLLPYINFPSRNISPNSGKDYGSSVAVFKGHGLIEEFSGKTAREDIYVVLDAEKFIAHIGEIYACSSDAREPLHGMIKKSISKLCDEHNNIFHPAVGIPAMHAEIRALNSYLIEIDRIYEVFRLQFDGSDEYEYKLKELDSIVKNLDQSLIISTLKARSGRAAAGLDVGKPFSACNNCAGLMAIIESSAEMKVDIPTGRLEWRCGGKVMR